jgi:hypothetical protein
MTNLLLGLRFPPALTPNDAVYISSRYTWSIPSLSLAKKGVTAYHWPGSLTSHPPLGISPGSFSANFLECLNDVPVPPTMHGNAWESVDHNLATPGQDDNNPIVHEWLCQCYQTGYLSNHSVLHTHTPGNRGPGILSWVLSTIEMKWSRDHVLTCSYMRPRLVLDRLNLLVECLTRLTYNPKRVSERVPLYLSFYARASKIPHR